MSAMRFQPKEEDIPNGPFAGSLLIAHPSLRDYNFKNTVVLLTAHDNAEGSLGVIINKPMNQTLGEFDPDLKDSGLSSIPLYRGGPVASDQMILVAWKWAQTEGTFQLFFGIDEAKAQKIVEDDPDFQLRGFIGHSGWTEGQLEGEVEGGSWVISPITPDIEQEDSLLMWRAILGQVRPTMLLLADEPEDPSLN